MWCLKKKVFNTYFSKDWAEKIFQRGKIRKVEDSFILLFHKVLNELSYFDC